MTHLYYEYAPLTLTSNFNTVFQTFKANTIKNGCEVLLVAFGPFAFVGIASRTGMMHRNDMINSQSWVVE
jgi:hypothetical protein